MAENAPKVDEFALSNFTLTLSTRRGNFERELNVGNLTDT